MKKVATKWKVRAKQDRANREQIRQNQIKILEDMAEENYNPASCQTDVICRWRFFYEGGEDGWTFEVEAKDHEEAYEIAYDTHGPQVKGMMYYNVTTNGI